MKSFEDLHVWRKAIHLVQDIYRATELFPRAERFGLTNQIRRAAISVPSNIAEGQGRLTAGEWLQFLGNARGSLYELRTQLVVAKGLGLITPAEYRRLEASAHEIGRALSGLIEYVRRRAAPRKS